MVNPFGVAVLASGSRGNATFIRSGREKFLVDIGISVRCLQQRLSDIGRKVEDLTAVFITHEHIDHIRGLEVFLKHYDVPVYSSAKTGSALLKLMPGLCCSDLKRFDGTKKIGDVTVTSFPVSHDAVDPHGYTFVQNDHKLTYVTDLGVVTGVVQSAIEDCDTLVIESNHDEDMLMRGPYPIRLKKRILSTKGHLANITAARTLAGLECLPKSIILAHLSQQNNSPELVLKTVQQELAKTGRETSIHVAMQDSVVTDFQSEEVELWKEC